jgi:transposase
MSLDVHCVTCEFAAATPGGKLLDRRSIPTAVPPLVEAICSVPRPRSLVFEEGPLADWLYRSLRSHVDQITVCDPRRNHLIARDGDKDDPIDTVKLLELARGGYVRPVHHTESEDRSIFKQHVALYHDRVRHKVAEALRIIWALRRFGIVVLQNAFTNPERRPELLAKLPADRTVHDNLQLMLESYDLTVGHVDQLRRRMIDRARRIEPIRRFTKLPGVKWVRASTFYAYVDTPWRFRSKQALWKYLGIGLERRGSGTGFERLAVPRRANFMLKDVILGAAKSAARTEDNPFADQYERWLANGCSPRIARRNTARSLAAVMWGMWKSNSDYRPDWVAVPSDRGGRATVRG